MTRRLTAVAATALTVLSACSRPDAPARHINSTAARQPAVAPAETPVTLTMGTIQTASHDRAPRLVPSRAARPMIDPATVWESLARCESGGDPRAVSRSGRYRGAFQFSMATWRSLGYGGDPIDHPYDVQLEAARLLQARSGWGQWPACARRLGLR